MKPNFIGIIAGIVAFISLVLPWWTMTLSTSVMGVGVSVDFLVYPYQARVSALGFAAGVPMDLWYGYAALAFIVISGLLAIVGSLTVYGKKLLIGGVVLAFLSILIFAVGLQMTLSNLSSIPLGTTGITGFRGIGLFSSGTIDFSSMGTTFSMNYSTMLTFGFWIALVAAIIMLVALWKHPVEAAPPPQPIQPPPQPPPQPPA